MPGIAEQAGPVTGGAGTRAGVRVAAVAGRVGRVRGTQAFPATAAGYRAAVAWMRAQGELVKAGAGAPAAMVPGWPAAWPAAALRWPK
jgi:transposase